MSSALVNSTIQSCVLIAISNLTAQFITAYKTGTAYTINWTAIIQFVIFNALNTPPNFLWQSFLETTFPSTYLTPSPSALKAAANNNEKELDREEKIHEILESKLSVPNTIIKLFLDQSVGAAGNTIMFSLAIAGFKGATFEQAVSGAREDFWPLMVAGWKFWPAVSLINFTLVQSVEMRQLIGFYIPLRLYLEKLPLSSLPESSPDPIQLVTCRGFEEPTCILNITQYSRPYPRPPRLHNNLHHLTQSKPLRSPPPPNRPLFQTTPPSSSPPSPPPPHHPQQSPPKSPPYPQPPPRPTTQHPLTILPPAPKYHSHHYLHYYHRDSFRWGDAGGEDKMCDEEKPSCSNCIRHRVSCSFLQYIPLDSQPKPHQPKRRMPKPFQATERLSPPPSREPSPSKGLYSLPHEFKTLDLELLHFYTTITSHEILGPHVTGTPIWRTSIVTLSFSHPFLLHELFSISALHLVFLYSSNPDPTPSQKYSQAATVHHVKWITAFRSEIQNITRHWVEEGLLWDMIRPWKVISRHTTIGSLQVIDGAQLDGIAAYWTNADLSTEDNVALDETLQALIYVFTLASTTGSEISSCIATLSWTTLIPQRFCEMVEERYPQALVLVAAYCVLLKRIEEFWWIRGKAESLLAVVRRGLPGEEWGEWLRWPVEEINGME
ncbi:hypothetical protein G7Y89_g11191 [Cudoniella acicularis]|uniref:Zn(2)-C6 fungal-type domain-containing protein n=1 Tax=Cudoniella acicularis TaxID=354080 RepID=A0A8H4RDN9_9HELO|nr:hypothetical protein G7Y89_g11191 [Cudoniella acicularis]